MVADQTGSLSGVKRHDYLPFGEELTWQGGRDSGHGYNTDSVKQKYTGYEHDGETNLNFAEARYHSDQQGRFTSVDPLAASAKLTDPQTLNRYSYVGNKPTVYSDPSGMSAHLGGRNISNFNGAMASEQATDGITPWPDVPIEAAVEATKGDSLDTVGADGKATADTNNQNVGAVTQEPAQQQQNIQDPSELILCGPNSNVTDASQLPPVQSLSPQHISASGLDFIKRWEKFMANLYNDQGGNCTIGYGHLLHMGGCDAADRRAYPNGVTEAQATQILANDVSGSERTVRNSVRVTLTQNQFDALVIFAFNIGNGGFRGSSALKELNRGNYNAVPDRMAKWNTTGGKVSRGLIRRRSEEGKLFMTP
jgi:lysozyme